MQRFGIRSGYQGLQWGRVVIDAERFSGEEPDSFRGPLQWGRVVIDAER